uniref:Uncharacterized protein n=1 Tax=Malus domestica TaxID=3750 RepID=E4Z8Q1_MALDO|nr:hypothetical protein [Malus domestica]
MTTQAAGFKLLMIRLRVMRCSCEKCGVLFIPIILRKWVGKELKNRCPVVGNYLAKCLVRGETPWHQLVELQAQAWYGAKSKSKSKTFTWFECWNIIKDCPKFKIVSVGPEVFMNNVHLHSTPDHASHDCDEDDAEEVLETPPIEQASRSTRFPIRPQGKIQKRKHLYILKIMSNFSILEAESPPPTALAVQFVIVQYSFKIPLSFFALSDSVHLYSSSGIRVVNSRHRSCFFAGAYYLKVRYVMHATIVEELILPHHFPLLRKPYINNKLHACESLQCCNYFNVEVFKTVNRQEPNRNRCRPNRKVLVINLSGIASNRTVDIFRFRFRFKGGIALNRIMPTPNCSSTHS